MFSSHLHAAEQQLAPSHSPSKTSSRHSLEVQLNTCSTHESTSWHAAPASRQGWQAYLVEWRMYKLGSSPGRAPPAAPASLPEMGTSPESCHCCRPADCGVLAAWPSGLNRRLNRPPVNPIPYLGTNLRQMYHVWWSFVGVRLDRTSSRSTATHATPDCQVATCRKKDKQHLQAHPDNTSGVSAPDLRIECTIVMVTATLFFCKVLPKTDQFTNSSQVMPGRALTYEQSKTMKSSNIGDWQSIAGIATVRINLCSLHRFRTPLGRARLTEG